MGTRGAVGFRVGKQDKVTYNHFDSYPSGLGQEVLDFIQANSVESLTKAAENIQMIDMSVKPTKEQIKVCEPWTDLTVSEQSTEDWYCLTRLAQGNLNAYVEGLPYMNDSSSFLLDSLFCEYAYIINLDSKKLEFYSGFNQKQRECKGRYASLKREGRDSGYFGVVLIMQIPLESIMEANSEEISSIISKMQKKSDSFYHRQDRELRKQKQ